MACNDSGRKWQILCRTKIPQVNRGQPENRRWRAFFHLDPSSRGWKIGVSSRGRCGRKVLLIFLFSRRKPFANVAQIKCSGPALNTLANIGVCLGFRRAILQLPHPAKATATTTQTTGTAPSRLRLTVGLLRIPTAHVHELLVTYIEGKTSMSPSGFPCRWEGRTSLSRACRKSAVFYFQFLLAVKLFHHPCCWNAHAQNVVCGGLFCYAL